MRARDQQRVGEGDTGRVCARSSGASAMGIGAEGTQLLRPLDTLHGEQVELEAEHLRF